MSSTTQLSFKPVEQSVHVNIHKQGPDSEPKKPIKFHLSSPPSTLPSVASLPKKPIKFHLPSSPSTLPPVASLPKKPIKFHLPSSLSTLPPVASLPKKPIKFHLPSSPSTLPPSTLLPVVSLEYITDKDLILNRAKNAPTYCTSAFFNKF